MKKRVISVLLAVTLVFSCCVISVSARTTSGSMGNIKWSYNEKTYTLTITGKGPMPNSWFKDSDMTPWRYYSCTPIHHVVIGEGITSLGKETCVLMDLQSIKLPSTLEHIGSSAFDQTTFVSGELTLPSKVTSIDESAFYYAKLKTLHLPAGLKTIKNRAFQHSSIENINLNNVETIGEEAFRDCQHLKAPVNLTNLVSLGKQAFYDSFNLTGVQFGNRLSSISPEAFAGTAITSLDIPGNIKRIEWEAFDDCYITSLKLHEGLESIGHRAFMISLIEDLDLPSSMRYIADNAFLSYANIYLNEGLEVLGEWAICKQKALAVPSSMRSMQQRYEPVIALGKPFSSSVWDSGTIYTWYPKEQWEKRLFQKVDFRMLEEEIIELYAGQTIFLDQDPSVCTLLDGRRTTLNGNALSGIKKCYDVLIENRDGVEINHLIRVLPLPASCGGTHIWGPGTQQKPATCTEEGTMLYSCLVCGAKKTEPTPIDRNNHAWTFTEVISQPDEDSQHGCTGLYTCSRCGETKEARLCAGEIFTDMPADDNWAHDPIDWAYFHDPQITDGMTETTFAPNATCTRAQVVTFLWRFAGCDSIENYEYEPYPFTDVPENSWFYCPVYWAYFHNITDGITDSSFAPNQTCTRSQVVTFLWRAAGEPEPENTDNLFTDVPENSWFYKPVLWALEKGITDGVSDTEFGSKLPCTRAQVVTFLYRFARSLEPEPLPENGEPIFVHASWFNFGCVEDQIPDQPINYWDLVHLRLKDSKVPTVHVYTDNSDVLSVEDGNVFLDENAEAEEINGYTYRSYDCDFGVNTIGYGTANFFIEVDGILLKTYTINVPEYPRSVLRFEFKNGGNESTIKLRRYSIIAMTVEGCVMPEIYTDHPEIVRVESPEDVGREGRVCNYEIAVTGVGLGTANVYCKYDGEIVYTIQVTVVPEGS